MLSLMQNAHQRAESAMRNEPCALDSLPSVTKGFLATVYPKLHPRFLSRCVESRLIRAY
jgi:hypothetical protein